jgi:hypothetical protein
MLAYMAIVITYLKQIKYFSRIVASGLVSLLFYYWRSYFLSSELYTALPYPPTIVKPQWTGKSFLKYIFFFSKIRDELPQSFSKTSLSEAALHLEGAMTSTEKSQLWRCSIPAPPVEENKQPIQFYNLSALM